MTSFLRAIALGFLALFLPLTAVAEQADFSAYQRLLERHVATDTVNGIQLNVVNYAAWAADPDHPLAVKALEGFQTAKLGTREEQLAFWINAYNLLAVKTVIDTGVDDSIKDAGSFFSPVWKRVAGRINGREVTLDRLEHQILRPMGEPRVHLAIVCASLSCPDLRMEAYTAEKLDRQLDEQTRSFLANPTKGLTADNGRLVISKIFDWFDEDFNGGVLGFIQHHSAVPEDSRIDDYFDYDWSLNKPG
jgi:hypothetical protein